MNTTNHLLIFAQPNFVDFQVRNVLAQSTPVGSGKLGRLLRTVLRHA